MPISVLKPLAGVDDGLEDNLRSFFEQDYPEFEILFAVRSAGRPGDRGGGAAAGARIRAVPSRLIVTGEPPYPNAKVYSLDLHAGGGAPRSAGDGRQRHSRDAATCSRRSPRNSRIRGSAWRRARIARCRGTVSGPRWRRSG